MAGINSIASCEPLSGVSTFLDEDSSHRFGLYFDLEKFDVQQDAAALIQRFSARLLAEYDRIHAEFADAPSSHGVLEQATECEWTSFGEQYHENFFLEIFPFRADRETVAKQLPDTVKKMLTFLRTGETKAEADSSRHKSEAQLDSYNAASIALDVSDVLRSLCHFAYKSESFEDFEAFHMLAYELLPKLGLKLDVVRIKLESSPTGNFADGTLAGMFNNKN